MDEELTGVPTDTALGDDEDGMTPDDEDGVVFLDPIMPGETVRVQVTASANGGYLNAWIDFDGVGTLDKLELTNTATGTTATDNLWLNGGTQTLEFTAPDTPDPFPTTLYSRFRFTKTDTDGGDTSTGLARSGEVEDYALGSLGSRLWRDNGAGGGGNNNGQQDGSELGLEDATVELYRQGQTPGVDAPIATTITDANGDYRFTGLPDGTYTVYLPPSNFQAGGALENLYSSSDPSSGPNNPNIGQPGYGRDQGQDENGIDDDYPYDNGISSLPIDLTLGDEPTGEDGDANSDLTLDFGFIRLDFGDLPDQYGTSMAEDGPRHVIDDVTFLGAGVDAESDGHPTVTALGDDAVFNDDEDGVRFVTPAIMPGEEFEIEVEASVDGYLNAWIDWNGDGDFDDADEQIVTPDYALNSGTNTLTLTAPDFNQADVPSLYSRFRFTNTTGEATTPTGEAANGEVEDYALLSLGDLVWLDTGDGNKADNGIFDSGETPVPGVNVELYEAGQTPGVDTPIATTTTDANGRYRFTGLQAGDYVVHLPASEFGSGGPLNDLVSSLGNGLANADADETSDENGIDTDNLATTGISSDMVSLNYGTEPTGEDGDPNSNLTVDFGFLELSSLGDYVWFDENRNGVQDAAEPGIEGVEVNLYDKNGNLVESMTTDSSGKYLFTDLRPGNYYLEFILPPGYEITSQNQGGNDGNDSDVDPLTGRTMLISLGSGVTDLRWDAGLALIQPPKAVPTPTAGPSPPPDSSPDGAPTPTPTPTVTPTPTPTPDDRLFHEGQLFGKRRELVEIEEPCYVVPAEIEDPWFITDIAMYASSEMQMTSQPLVEWSEQTGLTLDEASLARTGVLQFSTEVMEFSTRNVNTLLMNSGMGLHLKDAPMLQQQAQARHMTPEEYVAARLQQFARRSHLKTIPANPYPLFLEFAEGDPRHTTAVDINNWATMRWDDTRANKHLIPSAYGQTLLRQVLLVREFLSVNHTADGQKDPNGEFIGVNDVKGFLGLVVIDQMSQKLRFMQDYLVHQPEDGQGVPYFPHEMTVNVPSLASDDPELRIVEDDSHLFDQASLLWALSELLLVTGPDAPPQFRRIPELAGLHERAAQLADIVFATIRNRHYWPAEHTLLEVASDDDEKTTVLTQHLGLTIVALERYYAANMGNPTAQAAILSLIQVAADFLTEYLYDPEDGGFVHERDLQPESDEPEAEANSSKSADNGPQNKNKTLAAQMTAIRGLLAAYHVIQEERYKERAFQTFAYAQKSLWDRDLNIYKDQARNATYSYTPLDVGAVVGALRELLYQAEDPRLAMKILTQMQKFTKRIAKYAGLQLSEVITESSQSFIRSVNADEVIRTAESLDSPFGLAHVFGSEVSLNREAINALHAKRPTDSCGGTRSAFRSTYYYTDIGMYAASEQVFMHQQFTSSSAAGQHSRTVTAKTEDAEDTEGKNRNYELLNPMLLDTVSAKSAEFADRNLIHVFAKAGLGVYLQYGPVFQQRAEAANLSADEYLQQLLKTYAKLVGMETVPKHLLPVFVEFEGGVPETYYDEKEQRWRNVDKSLIPSAIGQTLLRQVLWMEDVLATRHDQNNRPDPNGAFLGRTVQEGFIGLLVAEAVANKLVFLRDTMLVPVDPDDATAGRYIPHRFEVDFNGRAPKAYTVRNDSSQLFDQASLLWALSELKRLTDPQGAYTDVFGPQGVVGDYHELVIALIATLLDNLETFHWNAAYQTLYDVNPLTPDAPTNQTTTQTISTDKAAVAMLALESVVQNFTDAPQVQARAARLLTGQARFVLQYLVRPADGAVYNGATLADEVQPIGGLKTLLAHTAGLRALLVASRVTGEPHYLAQAKQTFEFFDQKFWDARLQVYKSAIGGSEHHYTPFNVGMTIGALREMFAQAGAEYVEIISTHLSKFFERVVERVGLQLSEQQHMYEALKTPTNLAPVIASDLLLQPVGSTVDHTIPQPGSVLTYTIEFSESALICDAAAAYVQDELPAGVSLIRARPAPASFDGQLIRWRVSDLSPDEDGVYSIRLEVRVDPLTLFGVEAELAGRRRSWNVNNCAALWCQEAGQPEQQVYGDCASSEVQVPQLGLEKAFLGVVAEPGGELEFEIMVTNLSDVTAYRVTIEDQLPDGFTYIPDSVRSSDTAGISLDDTRPLVWVLENLEPNQSLRFTYKVMLDRAIEAGLYTSLATVYGMDRAGFQFKTSEVELVVKVERNLRLEVSSTLSDPQPASPGQPVTVVTTIDNIGSDSLQGGNVQVTLPPGLRYVPGSSQINGVAVADPSVAGPTLEWTLGELAVGVQKTLQYRVHSHSRGAQTVSTQVQGTTGTGMAYASRPETVTVTYEPAD